MISPPQVLLQAGRHATSKRDQVLTMSRGWKSTCSTLMFNKWNHIYNTSVCCWPGFGNVSFKGNINTVKCYVRLPVNRSWVIMSYYVTYGCMGLKSENINYCKANDEFHKVFKTSQYSYQDANWPAPKLFWVLFNLLLGYVSSLSLWHHFVEKHYYISMSSSPELWATEKPYRGACVSAGGLEELSGLWGLGEGHGVGDCRHAVCCLRCFCNESLSLWLKGSSGGRHNTNSIQERLTDWATVWGRMSLMPCCRPFFKLSDITSTGRLGAGSTSRSSSSSSSSVILSSISWSFLWAASISMQELSVSRRNREEEVCGKVKLFDVVQGFGGAGLACCADWGLQLFAVGQSQWALVLKFSEGATSASNINLLFLALHPSSSALLLCFLRHLVSQLLLETVALCMCSLIPEGPRSKSGRLVGPENEYMAGRHLSSLLEGAEWCMVVQSIKWFEERRK